MRSLHLLSAATLLTLSFHYSSAQDNRPAQNVRIILVVDSISHKPLSFASAVFRDTRKGTIADVDGQLFLRGPLPDQPITISRVGYRSKRFKPSGIPDTVLLAPASAALQEVVVTVSDESDPRADWIIRQTIKNKPLNNPDNLSNYTYTSYNKLIADLSGGTNQLFAPPSEKDATRKPARKPTAMDSLPKHLFLIESVIDHAYKKPLLRQETVKAQKISGLSKGYLLGLATQLQYFSFYPDNFALLGVQYYNPVSAKYRGDYVFHMVDSLKNEDGSLTWIISFRPHRKRFGLELLKGELHIHENDFGLVNVIASPLTTNAMFNISFRQQYRLVKDHWFPAQLNTDIVLNANQNANPGKDTAGRRSALVVTARTDLQDISIDSTLSRKRFGNYRYTLDPDVDDQSAQFWEQHRTIKLDSLDRNTYHFLDSLTKSNPDIRKQQFKIDVIGDIVRGEIPMGKINLKISQLINYNEYEGLRLGAGFVTNTRFSKDVRIGAYGGYGFADHAFKYGGLMEFPVGYNKEVTYGASFSQDIILEGINSFKGAPLFNYQNLLARRADSLQKIEVYRKGWMGKVIQSRLYVNYQHRTFTQGYHFLDPVKQGVQYNGLKLVEAGGSFGTDFKQGLLEAGNLVINSLAIERTNFLELELKAGKSMDAASSISYQKAELRYTRQFILGRPGKISTILEGGKVWGNLPYGMLFSNLGTYDRFSVNIPATFQTMRWYEFINDAYAALFFNYETGYLIQRRDQFGLSLLFAQNTGVGSLSSAQLHVGIAAVPMDPVYTEVGFGLHLRTARHNYSIMSFYRYGNYNLPKTMDNFSWRILYQ
jgi:hypothetical protein